MCKCDMFVCVLLCAPVYMYVHVYVCVLCVHVHVCMCTHLYVHMCVVYVCMCVCSPVCVHVCSCAYICMCVCVYGVGNTTNSSTLSEFQHLRKSTSVLVLRCSTVLKLIQWCHQPCS